MVECRWAEETIVLSPLKTAYLVSTRTLCVADVHLGKAAAFRVAGVPVPESTTDADLERLSQAIAQFDVRRLVILGDLIHAKAGRTEQPMQAFCDWRRRHERLDVLLIRGNHDARAGDPPTEWCVRVADEPHAERDDRTIAFAHYPEAAAKCEDRRVLCGHVHPAVRLHGGVRSMRAACFWFGSRVGILPAFGSFTGTAVVTPRAGDDVFVVGEGEVVRVGTRAATPG